MQFTLQRLLFLGEKKKNGYVTPFNEFNNAWQGGGRGKMDTESRHLSGYDFCVFPFFCFKENRKLIDILYERSCIVSDSHHLFFNFLSFLVVRSGGVRRDSVGGFRPCSAVARISSTRRTAQDPTAGGEISLATRGIRRQSTRRPAPSHVGHHLPGFRQCGQFAISVAR